MCKEWLNLIRYDSILSGNLIITTDKGAKDINRLLQSFPMLEAVVLKLHHHDAEASLEFIKGLNFDCCPGLEKVSAIDFTLFSFKYAYFGTNFLQFLH